MTPPEEHENRPVADVGDRSGRRPGGEDMEVVRSEEELRVHRAERPFGSARLRTEIVERDVAEVVDLMADDVEVVELPVPDPDADSGEVETSPEGDLSVPVMAERLVLRKETYVEKRILLRRARRLHAREEVHETLRAERVVVDVDRAPTPGERAAARATGGEDLSRGPTPETRHPDGALDDVRDTTQGPTPEIRRAMRADAADGAAAAGEPVHDRRTRADVGGEQDRLDAETTSERTVIEPGAPQVAIEAPGDTSHDRSDT